MIAHTMHSGKALGAILIAVLLPPGVCAQRRGSKMARDPEALKAGKALFAGACSACHGVNGEGGHGPNLTESHEVRRASDEDIFRSIRNGVAGTDMPPFKNPDAQIWQLIAFVRSLSAPAVESDPTGDVRAGREIFFGAGGCSNCHMIHGLGGFPGPDLSDIGATRTLEQLRKALLTPNARPRADFRPVAATLRDGGEIRGVARSSTNYSLGILDARGQLHLLSMDQVQKITYGAKSLMPDDYSRRLTPQEIENLLAFLSRQSINRRNPE
jgi:putative heme-binding domain-containing protein